MTATPEATIAGAWHERAEELADWALARVFVRTDRFGGYYRGGPDTKKSARPNKGCAEAFSRGVVVRHFKAGKPEDVLGSYPLTPGEGSSGRWLAVDIDNHGDGDDPELNRKYAIHLYQKLAALGFRVLLVTWGTGGYHLWVFLARDIPAAALYAFARWVVGGAAEFGYRTPPETFPKQDHVREGKFGNWLRVPGRHYKKPVWAAVYDGASWLEGRDAVSHLLTITGDDPGLIPAGAKPVSKERRAAAAPRPSGPKFTVPKSRPDVFAAYNRSTDLDTVVGWHAAEGHAVTRREAGRVEFTRAGKDGAGQSFNVKTIDGVPVTYNFSTKAGIPDGKGLSPAQVRCLHQTGRCDTAAMSAFAAVLRKELGWAEEEEKTDRDEDPTADPGMPPEGKAEERPASPRFSFTDTDLANGRRFVADNRDDVRYVADWKRWAVYDGVRWRVDESGAEAARLAHRTLQRMADEAAARVAAAARRRAEAVTEEEEGAAEKEQAAAARDLTWAKKSQDAKRIGAMLETARPYVLVSCGGEVFDTDRHLLNCPNGTIDLRTGELLAHRREDYITKLCPTAFDPSAGADAYRRFLRAVADSEETADYLRELSGYAATGEVSDQSLVLGNGKGSNGKTTLFDTWVAVLGEGEYAASVPSELVEEGGENRHPVEKTVLRGARLAVCQETEDGASLNAKRVKYLTGGNPITARGMRQNFFTFNPTHTLFVATNHLPRIPGTDHATWRRIRVVNFPHTFWTETDRKKAPDGTYPPHLRADPDLPAKLRAEAAGILADMVANAVEFYANRRLSPPRRVMQDVAAYQAREDVVSHFLDECVVRVRDGERGTRGGELYVAFCAWYARQVNPDDNRGRPSHRTFGEAAEKRFGGRMSRGRVVYPVRVITPPPPRAGGEEDLADIEEREGINEFGGG